MASGIYRSYDYEDKKGRMSLEEAEDILEDRARSKDFWAVDYYDNRSKLQLAVDVMYNSILGNRYTVDYQDNQNGTRLIIRCEICEKELTSYDPFITHEKGKPHKKIRQQNLTPKDPNLQGTLERRPHNTYRGVFPEDSLEDMIDSTAKTILGIHFIYKEVICGTEKFTCQLCQKGGSVTAIKASKMLNHVKSMDHIRKYMEVKFGYIKKMYGDFEDEAKQIERQEGKIHVPIVDFSKQLPDSKLSGASSSNYEPLGSRKMKLSPDSRARRRSPSPCESYIQSHQSRSRSRSCSVIHDRISSPSNSWEGRSPSPALFDVRTEPVVGPRTPPPPSPEREAKPVMVDRAITVDMSDYCKPVLEEIKVLNTKEAQEIILNDPEKEELLHQTLWILNEKLDRYYEMKDLDCYDDKNHYVSKAVISTGKLKEHLCKLEAVTQDAD